VLAPVASAAAKPGAKPWPPASGKGQLYVHFGEEHINDADGATLLPKVVRASARYRPELVTMSGDKANDGEPAQLELWADVMKRYDRKGIPWFAGVGNHDRKAPPGFPGGLVPGDFAPYRDFFADRPYPMGDAPGYSGFSPRKRPAGDPTGASTHYFVDHGHTRWIFIDNSCWSIILCDPLQHPSAQNQGGSETQFNFMRRVGQAATADGKLVFVVMHMPTEDPGDQLYRDPTAVLHTMGKTAAGILDNTLFEQAAVQAGVDGVFVAHIKGQFLYRGQGDIPYFIDGGAGGELYTTGPVGTDHGYWHGFRMLRVRGDRFRTDAVPIFVRHGITIEGPHRLRRGSAVTYAAFGRQPVFNDPAKVEALELRDPDPTPRLKAQAPSLAWPSILARWLGPPLASLALILLIAGVRSRRRLGLRLALPCLAAIAALSVGGISLAQQSEPTSTPVASLPNPARMWTSSNPAVLKPVASETDDRRRNERTQTSDGRFRAVCPGTARLTIASGFATASKKVVVPGDPREHLGCPVQGR
jgi:hypothetical protein